MCLERQCAALRSYSHHHGSTTTSGRERECEGHHAARYLGLSLAAFHTGRDMSNASSTFKEDSAGLG